MSDEMKEILDEFVVESSEQLAEVEQLLLDLGQGGGEAQEEIGAIFRAFHSMKGSGSFLGLDHLVSVTHKAESLLQIIRDANIPLLEPHIDLLYHCYDFCTEAFSVIAANGDDDAIKERAEYMAAVLLDEQDRTRRYAETGVYGDDAPALEEEEEDLAGESVGGVVFLQPTPIAQDEDEGAEPDEAKAQDEKQASERLTLLAPPEWMQNLPQDDAPQPKPSAAVDEPLQLPPTPEAPTRTRPPKQGGVQATSTPTIRVDVDKLDSLMNLVGELILAETMVTHNPDLEGLELENFQKAALQLNRITRGLQDIAMSVRMLPLRGTLRKMNRIVRDVSRKQGKDVELTLSGEDTEVDKNLIELIADPLVHIVRNAVDHGLESTHDRLEAGKPPTGRVHIAARQEGGEVWVSIQDDGAGLDRDKILSKARERGLYRGSGAELEDERVFEFIFQPGFSTAEQVTDVSGRGVGMDVVRQNIEELKGAISVSSQRGVGTTITLKIPLTLAIIDGMLIRAGDMIYTVPVLAIETTFQSTPDMVSRLPNGDELVHVRGGFYPAMHLHTLMERPGTTEQVSLHDGVFVLVDAGRGKLCLLGDELLGQRQTVIKAMPPYLGQLKGVSGCSIMSDGEISLILDVKELSQEHRSKQVAPPNQGGQSEEGDDGTIRA